MNRAIRLAYGQNCPEYVIELERLLNLNTDAPVLVDAHEKSLRHALLEILCNPLDPPSVNSRGQTFLFNDIQYALGELHKRSAGNGSDHTQVHAGHAIISAVL